MVATVFSWRSDNSFISSSPPRDAKMMRMKHVTVVIHGQPYELHRLIAEILREYHRAVSVTNTDIELSLIIQHEIQTGDTDIGLSLIIQHKIQTGNHPPIHCKPYRYSLAERKTAFQRIRKFEANRWIDPVTGPWSFPVVLVPKKNGSVHICIDYRKLNDITIKDVYPLPRIDDLLDAIECANYFSKFDIRHGFHHILVKEEDRPKMAFVLFEVPLIKPSQWEIWCENYFTLSLCLVRIELTWTQDSEHRATSEGVQLLIIQAWRSEVEGNLLGFVDRGHHQTIVWELLVPFAHLLDDLPTDIISHHDENLAPHVLSRSLMSYLQWSACLEDRGGRCSYPSRAEYLNPRLQPRTASEEEAVEEEVTEEDEEEETSEEEGSYSEYSEEEPGAVSEEEEEEGEESEWESLGGEADQAEGREEDPAVAERRKEIAAGKRPLEHSSGTNLPIPEDPTRDPKPPSIEDELPPAETSSAPARR
ncbi:hypothetical protein CBR_g55693 [Chara braunii]|uniref:Reverse transcriptase domain-containing protein n=1 Tax=Chara braunii TaxID=69332 RepID=A0A388MD49_CHABU|nr:hypothetical protein CBR_g55693 [Chara braunii]|eukprot:GBG92488.1 hypothetical protein CBR_g55693 [Chara braunii]